MPPKDVIKSNPNKATKLLSPVLGISFLILSFLSSAFTICPLSVISNSPTSVVFS